MIFTPIIFTLFALAGVQATEVSTNGARKKNHFFGYLYDL